MQAQLARSRMRRHFDAAMEQVDVMVTPSTPHTAPGRAVEATAYHEFDMSLGTSLMKFSQLTNLLGGAAVSVPVGRDVKGLPVGCVSLSACRTRARLLCTQSACREPLGGRADCKSSHQRGTRRRSCWWRTRWSSRREWRRGLTASARRPLAQFARPATRC